MQNSLDIGHILSNLNLDDIENWKSQISFMITLVHCGRERGIICFVF